MPLPPPPPSPMDELVKDCFLRLSDDLIEEVFFRLPPNEPAWLVRASAVHKPWRQILADAGFRRRYREFHRTPPVLGLFQENARFVPTSTLLPALPHRPHWIPLDCRHGRALFATYTSTRYYVHPSDFTVLDPLTGQQRRVPFPVDGGLWFSAAVLCAAQGCDHHGCQEGNFLVVFISADEQDRATSARVYSSETDAWSELISIPEPNVMYCCIIHVLSVLVGDAVYFNSENIVKYQLGTRSLSMFEKPTNGDGTLMTAEDGGLGFAAVVDAYDTNLVLWLRETEHDGAAGWTKLMVIDLKVLLPDDALLYPTIEYATNWSQDTLVSGAVEGTQVIFVTTYAGCYMVDIKSGRATEVSCGYAEKLFPYVRFYIPAMKAASTAKGQ